MDAGVNDKTDNTVFVIDYTPITKKYTYKQIDDVLTHAAVLLYHRNEKWYNKLNPFKGDPIKDLEYLEQEIKKEFENVLV